MGEPEAKMIVGLVKIGTNALQKTDLMPGRIQGTVKNVGRLHCVVRTQTSSGFSSRIVD